MSKEKVSLKRPFLTTIGRILNFHTGPHNRVVISIHREIKSHKIIFGLYYTFFFICMHANQYTQARIRF